MSWNLTLPPKPAAAVAAERDPEAYTAGFVAGTAAERAKMSEAAAPKGQPAAETIVWDEVAAELNAQAGLNTRSEG